MNWPQISNFVALPLKVEQDWKNDDDLKKLFAIELAKQPEKPFDAALKIFDKEANKALWASVEWIKDPLVLNVKNNFIENLDDDVKLLNKEQLSLKLLFFAQETVLYNGNAIYSAEAKDRLAALKLYAEISGFMPKNNTEINNNFSPKNFMEIRFVEPERKEKKIINKTIDNIKPEDILESSPVKLKLVG